MSRDEKVDTKKGIFRRVFSLRVRPLKNRTLKILLVIPILLVSALFIFNHASFAADNTEATAEPTFSPTPNFTPTPTLEGTDLLTPPTATPTASPTTTPTNPPSPSLIREGTVSPSPLIRGDEEGLISSGLVSSLVSQIQDKVVTPITSASVTQIATEDTDTGKLVTVSAPNEDPKHPLTNVEVSTTIPEIYKVGEESRIKINWQNNKDQSMQFKAEDTNGNGKLDQLTWTVPHLSTQTFEIIFISKAFKLDSEKNITDDIYDQVKEQDNQWSTINKDEYVRVTFNDILTNNNDITIYAKTKSNKAKVEVYPVYTDKDGNQTEGQLVTTFNNIKDKDTYKVLLTTLKKETDTFDLKITGGSIDFDYIVDPVGWLTGWSYRKKITIDNANVDADLTDFPALIKITADADMTTALATGYDIRFTNSGGTTLLKYERESWTGGAGDAVTANIWVKVPTISTAADTNIYMYYGKADATDGADPTNVWDSNFKGVWHLDETGTVTTWADSTSNNNGGTNYSATAESAGKINGAASFAGNSVIAKTIALNYSTGATIQAWAKTTNTGGHIGFMDIGTQGAYVHHTATTDVMYFLPNGWDSTAIGYDASDVFGAWSLWSFVANGTNDYIYKQGQVVSTGTSPTGAFNFGSVGRENLDSLWFTGLVDEVRISSTARSADWIKFEYNNMNSADNEMTFSAQEDLSWLTGWSYRKKITIDNANVDANLTDFPLLVKIAETGGASTNIGANALANGYDVRFTSNDGTTTLKYERESYSVSSSNLTANIWVKVPTISTSADTVIYMYYGKADASDGADPTNVWDSNFKGVYHLAETGTVTTWADSTSNNNDGTNNGATATTGKLSGGASIGNLKYIDLPSLSLSTINTTDFWLNYTGAGDGVVLGGATYAYSPYFSGPAVSDLIYYRAVQGAPSYASVAHNGFSFGTFEHVSLVRDGTSVKFYQGGGQISTTQTMASSDALTLSRIGAYSDGGAPFSGGVIDEVRISNTARSADWIKFEYNNMNSADNELAWDNQTTTTSYTWTNGTGDGLWSTAGNWAGGAAPGASNVAIFSDASTDNVSIDANISVAGINIVNGYTGTITQNSTRTITIGSEGFTQSGGTFTGADGGITLNGAYTLSGGTFNAGSQTINASTIWTYTAGTFNAQTSTVVFGHGQDSVETITGSMTFQNVNFVTGALDGAGHVEITSGTTLTVNGTLTFIPISTRHLVINTGTIAAKGDIVNSTSDGTGVSGTATLLINGTGDQTLTGNSSISNDGILAMTINKPSGTLTLAGFIGPSSWTYTAGTIDAGTSTVVFGHGNSSVNTITGSTTLQNVYFYGGTGDFGGGHIEITSGTTLTVNGTLTFDATVGRVIIIDTGTIAAKGDIIIADADGYRGTASFQLTGTANQTITSSGGDGTFQFSPTINKSSGTVTLASNLNLNNSGEDLTITSGTLDLNGKTLTVNDTLTIGASGILNTDNGSYTYGTLVNNGSIIDQRTWLGGTDTNWNTAANWSGGAVPGASQLVMFDDRCGSNCNATINADANVAGLTLASTYTGTLTQASTKTITIGSSGYTQAGGTFTGGDGAITNGGSFTLSGGTYNAGTSKLVFTTSGSLFTPGNGTYYDLEVNMGDTNSTLDVSGTANITHNLITTLGRFYSGTANVGGDVTASASANYYSVNSLVVLNGTGDQTISNVAGGALPSIQINKASGTVTLGSDIALRGTSWTHTTGGFDAAEKTITFNSGAGTFTPGSASYYNISLAMSSTNEVLAIVGTANITNNLTITTGRLDSGTINVGGAFDIESGGCYYSCNTAIVLNGTGTQNITFNPGGSTLFPGTVFTINKASGSAVLATNLSVGSAGQDLTLTSGTLDLNGKTLTVNDTLTIGASGILNTDNGSYTYGTLVNNGSIIDQRTWLGGTDTNWNTAANWSGGAVPGASQLVMFDDRCGSNCNATINADANVAGLTLASTYTGTLTQASTKTITIGSSGYTQAGGTFTGGDGAIDIAANFALNGGTFTSTSGTLTTNTATANNTDTFTVAAGTTFNHNNGTVSFAEGGCAAVDPTITISAPSGVTFKNVILSITGCRVSQASLTMAGDGTTATVSGNLTQTNSNLYGSWNLSGNFIIGAGSTGGTGTITFNGSSDQTYQFASGGHGPKIAVNKATGSVSPAVGTTELKIESLTLTDGAFTAPSGTLTLDPSQGVTNLLIVTSGTFNNNNGSVQINGVGWDSAESVISTSGTLTFNTLNMGVSTGRWGAGNMALSGDINANGTLTLEDGTITGLIGAKGNVVIGSGSDGAAALTLSGTNDQTFTNSGGTNPSGTVTINKASGTVTLASALTLNTAGQDLAITSGTLDLAGYNLTINDQFTIGASGTLKLQGGETVTGGPDTLSSGSTVVYNGTSGPYTLNNWAYSNLQLSSASATTYTAPAAMSPTGNLTIDANNTFSPGGFLITGSGTNVLTNAGTLLADNTTFGDSYTSWETQTMSAGSTVNYSKAGDQTIDSTLSYKNLAISGSGTKSLEADTTIPGNLTISSGTLNLSRNDLTVTGTFQNAGNLQLDNTETLDLTADTDSGTVTYTATGTQTTWNYPSSNVFQNLTIDAVGGTYKLPADLTVNGNLTLTNGILDLNGFNLTVSGNIVRTNGTFANTAGRTLTLSGTNQEVNTGDVEWHTVGVSSNVTAGSDLSVSNLLSIAVSKSLSLVSYVWSLLGNLINLGSVNEGTGHLAYASTSFAITDASFNTDAEISMPGDKVYLTLTDLDANTDGANLNTVPVTVTCPHDSEAVTLDETDIATGIFRNGGLDTATYDGSAIADDGTLECSDNDSITASYADPQDSGDTANATATATTDTATTAPSSFAGTAASSTSITWTWTDNANNERGFKLYSGTGTLIATINTANTATYTETGLTKGTSYTRKVVAYNNAGNSSFSSTASVTTPAEPTAPSLLSGSSSASTSIVWTWTDNSNDETGFKLLDSAGSTIATISTANTETYTETGLTKGTSYTRKVVSYNSDGTSAASNTSTVTTKTSSLNAPVLQSPVAGASLSTLLPSFTFGIDPNEDSGIASYIVYIDDSAKYSFSALSQDSGTTISGARVSSSGNSITVTATTDLTEGSHTWKVRAIDAAANTSDSAQRFFSLDITKPSVALTNTNLNISSARPTFGLVLGDTTELSKVTVTIEKITYFLGSELSRKTVFTKTYTIDGTTKDLSVTPNVDLAPGKYILTMTVEDTAGNKTTSEKEFTILEQTNSGEATLIQAEPPKTATEIKKLVEEGITPTKVPAVFQLQNLEKQAVIRQIKQAINLDEYIQHFIPTKFFTAFNNWLGNVETKISAWLKGVVNNTGTRIAGLFRQSVTGINGYLSKSKFFATSSWQSFAGLFRPAADSVGRRFAQGGSIVTNSWQHVSGFSKSARLNRLDLAVESEGYLDKIASPFGALEKRVALGTKAFVDGFTGQHEKELAITDVFASQPSPTGVQISWKTNRITRSKVNFGPTTMYGNDVFVDDFSLDHTVNLTDLTPNTKYYFEVLATDINNKQTYDAYYSFTTPEK